MSEVVKKFLRYVAIDTESKEEQEQMEEGYEHAVCAVKEIVTGNIEAAMNEYNRKKKEK